MKIRVTFELFDETRLAINALYGRKCMADRATCERFLNSNGHATLDEVTAEYHDARAKGPAHAPGEE